MKRLYVADDDPAIAQLIKFSLIKLEDIEVTFFNNGLELYRKVQESPPDAIVTDIILPGLEGRAIARLLKFNDDYKNIPLLIISSIIDPDIEEQVKNVKADDFLKKPFRPLEVRESVSNLLK